MLIELKDIGYKYPRTGFAVDIPTLVLDSEQTVAIVGDNGSGKTTLSKIIMGIIRPDRGQVVVDGVNIIGNRLYETARDIGYLFQNPDRHLICTSAMDEIVFALRYRGVDDDEARGSARQLLEEFSMLHLMDEYPLHFSRGEKQRLAIMSILAMEPRYLIMDEPTCSIDSDTKSTLIDTLEYIRGQGIGLCYITHDQDMIQIADTVLTMSDGEVVI